MAGYSIIGTIKPPRPDFFLRHFPAAACLRFFKMLSFSGKTFSVRPVHGDRHGLRRHRHRGVRRHAGSHRLHRFFPARELRSHAARVRPLRDRPDGGSLLHPAPCCPALQTQSHEDVQYPGPSENRNPTEVRIRQTALLHPLPRRHREYSQHTVSSTYFLTIRCLVNFGCTGFHQSDRLREFGAFLGTKKGASASAQKSLKRIVLPE